MGWLFTSGATKKSIIREITKDEPEIARCLAKTLRGNCLWTVMESQRDGKRYIVLYLLGSDKGYGWGYKDMDESMHPYYYTCPLSYLDMVPCPDNEHAKEWREQVRQKAASRVKGIHSGDVLIMKDGVRPHKLFVTTAKPLRAVDEYGIRYKVARRYIASVVAV